LSSSQPMAASPALQGLHRGADVATPQSPLEIALYLGGLLVIFALALLAARLILKLLLERNEHPSVFVAAVAGVGLVCAGLGVAAAAATIFAPVSTFVFLGVPQPHSRLIALLVQLCEIVVLAGLFTVIGSLAWRVRHWQRTP
jgi:hypothetical protein